MDKGDELFFMMFGIKSDSDDTLKIKRCIEKAYLDLCRTIKYKYSSQDVSKNKIENDNYDNIIEFVSNKSIFIENVEKIIIDAIDNYPRLSVDNQLLFDNYSNRFDNWFYALVNAIPNGDEKVFESGCSLSIGQKQKWVNMTIKYMRLMGLIEGELFKDKNDFHVPLDDYILSAAKRSDKIIDSDDINGLGIEIQKNGWSNIPNYDEYYELQIKIREKVKAIHPQLMPIEWEARAWIAEAIDRANK